MQSSYTVYIYDNVGNLIRTEEYDTDIFNWKNVKEFEWSDGNISRITFSRENDQPLYYIDYKYDNKTSYKYCNAFYIFNGANLSANNIIESETVVVGNIIIDSFCDVCTTKYEYEGDLPISFEQIPFSKKEISYQ